LVFDLRVFASLFIGIAAAARTPSVGRRARTRLVVVSLNFRTLPLENSPRLTNAWQGVI